MVYKLTAGQLDALTTTSTSTTLESSLPKGFNVSPDIKNTLLYLLDPKRGGREQLLTHNTLRANGITTFEQAIANPEFARIIRDIQNRYGTDIASGARITHERLTDDFVSATNSLSEKIDLSEFKLPLDNKRKAQFSNVKIGGGSSGVVQDAVRITIAADLNGDGLGTMTEMAKKLKAFGLKMVQIKLDEVPNEGFKMKQAGSGTDQRNIYHVERNKDGRSFYQLTVFGGPKKLQALIDSLTNQPGKDKDKINETKTVKWADDVRHTALRLKGQGDIKYQKVCALLLV